MSTKKSFTSSELSLCCVILIFPSHASLHRCWCYTKLDANMQCPSQKSLSSEYDVAKYNFLVTFCHHLQLLLLPQLPQRLAPDTSKYYVPVVLWFFSMALNLAPAWSWSIWSHFWFTLFAKSTNTAVFVNFASSILQDVCQHLSALRQ